MPNTPYPESRAQSAPLQDAQDIEQLVPNQYMIIDKVSQGGMGSIYTARNRFTGLNYAIKVLLPQNAADEEFRQRFISEAKAASLLKHEHICLVHDFGIMPDHSLYLVMDWIKGNTLQDKVEEDGPLDWERAVVLYEQIGAALMLAHQHKIVHRDLKPENIMLRSSSAMNAVLVDFGLAKQFEKGDETEQGLTTSGMAVGTPTYMSPEQARALEVDGRSDLYSMACVIYFALTGKPPFRGETALDTMLLHINETPPDFDKSLDIPADFKRIILKSMEKSADDRYQSMEQVLADLAKLKQGISIGKLKLAKEEQKQKAQRSTVLLFILGFFIAYLLMAFVQSALDKVIPAPAPAQAEKKLESAK